MEMGEFLASPEQATWLGWIPVPALILAADGSAVAVNPRWAAVLPVTAEGDGWVEAVEPPFRSMLRARLRLAAAVGEPGSVDCRVSGPRGSRWSRWWWHPAPSQNLVVCVGVIEDGQASAGRPSPRDDADRPAQAAALAASDVSISAGRAVAVVNRLFEAGLALESAASLLEGPLAAVVEGVVDDVDQLVRRIRSVVFESRAHPGDPPQQAD
jgi:hypothetical protein